MVLDCGGDYFSCWILRTWLLLVHTFVMDNRVFHLNKKTREYLEVTWLERKARVVEDKEEDFKVVFGSRIYRGICRERRKVKKN